MCDNVSMHLLIDAFGSARPGLAGLNRAREERRAFLANVERDARPGLPRHERKRMLTQRSRRTEGAGQ